MPGPAVEKMVSVTCMNCGNTLFFSAVVLGLVPPEEG
jgi:predicted nucleic-acid-binding Zn-ribbon protein